MFIGDVARRSGVSARMLRHYDSLGLVRPTGRTHGGYREYSSADIRRIFHVESLRSLGLSLRDVGRALDDPGFTPAGLVDDLIRRTRESIEAQQELLTRLRRIGEAEPADWADVLQTVALLRGLGSQSAGRRQRVALTSGDDVPVAALVEAALSESDPNVAGALRWALARAGDEALALLAEGLDAPAAEVRKRAVQSIAEIPGDAATELLRGALAHADAAVRRTAAPALATRGVPDTIPLLVIMIIGESSDSDTGSDAGCGSGAVSGPDGGAVSGPDGGAVFGPEAGPGSGAVFGPDAGPDGGAVSGADAEAADALAVLAGDPALADRIATDLVAALANSRPPARRRLTQALADIPGTVASRALDALSHDADRVVAATAAYTLKLRGGS